MSATQQDYIDAFRQGRKVTGKMKEAILSALDSREQVGFGLFSNYSQIKLFDTEAGRAEYIAKQLQGVDVIDVFDVYK